MQKQIVIASLLGAAAATAAANAPCEDMVTKVWTAKRDKLKGLTAGLAADLDAAKKADTAGLVPQKAATKVLTDYKLKVQKILDNYVTISALKTSTEKDIGGKTSAISTSDGQVIALGKLVTSAQTAYDAVWGPLANSERGVQQAVVDAMQKAEATHNNELATLKAIAARAAAAHVASQAVEATYQEDHDKYKLIVDNDAAALKADKEKASKGMEDKYVAAYAAGGGKVGYAATELANVGDAKAGVTEYWTAYSDYKQAAALTSGIDTECAANSNDCALLINKTAEHATIGKQQDYTAVLKALYTANKTAVNSGKKSAYDALTKAYGELLATKDYQFEEEAAAKAEYLLYKGYLANTYLKKVTDQKVEVAKALKAKETADTNVVDFGKYTGYFTKDIARGKADLAVIMAKAGPLNDALVIAKYNLDVEKKANAVLVAAKAALQAKLDAKKGSRTDAASKVVAADITTLVAEAKSTYDRVIQKITFYTQAQGVANQVYGVLTAKVATCDAAHKKNAADIKAADAMLADAVAVCKSNAYLKAQNAANAKALKATADDGLYKALVAGYAVKAAASMKAGAPATEADGAKKNIDNVVCAYPAKAADGSQPARPVCAEKYCCGAAQRHMKDGTKLSIETCQKKETKTYSYYPPLPAGATVAPTIQTWRFQCISGAQKLVAAATATLAASYMMA